MGHAGKRKEMVKDRRVQQMYVEGRCVKGVYAIVRKSGVYVCVCVIESCVKVRMYVCMCALCGHLNAGVMCACVCVGVHVYVCVCMCMNCRSRKESSSGTTNANVQAAAAGHLSSQFFH